MNKTSIEFADFSWNPLTGCAFGCEWCWAKKFNDRYKMQHDFSIPEFHPNRLLEKIPRIHKNRNYIAAKISPDKPIIFTIDMGDLFSPGVERAWQELVFDYIRDHQEANFLLLTKQPLHYLSRDIPKTNTFIGTSLDYAHHFKRVEAIRLMAMEGYRTFVNIEPIMSRMNMVDFSGIDFLIVGALTGRAYCPDPYWHRSIIHSTIYYKNNYLFYFPELKK